MRDIKFRAWDKYNKKMIQSENILNISFVRTKIFYSLKSPKCHKCLINIISDTKLLTSLGFYDE